MATVGSSPFYSVAVSVRSVPPQCGVARLFLRGIVGRPVVEVRRNCGAKLLDWIRVRLPTTSLHAVPVVAYHVPSAGNLRETIAGFTVPLPCFFPLCLVGRLKSPRGATKGVQQMGRYQAEIYYPTEASYLKSVLLWLQEYWTGPAVQVRPLKAVPQASRYNAFEDHRFTKSTGRNNRSACVLATPKLVTIPPAKAHNR